MVFFFFVVVERNLNPKAACLKRREEEKAEDNVGPKLGHHLSVAQHMVVQAPHFPPMTLVSLFNWINIFNWR